MGNVDVRKPLQRRGWLVVAPALLFAGLAVATALSTGGAEGVSVSAPASEAWPVEVTLQVRTAHPESGELVPGARLVYEARSWTSWRLERWAVDGEVACYEQDGHEIRYHLFSQQGCDREPDESSRAETDADGNPLPHAVDEHLVQGLFESVASAGSGVGPYDVGAASVSADALAAFEVAGTCASGRCVTDPDDGGERTEHWVFDRDNGIALYRQVAQDGRVLLQVETITYERG